MTGRQQRNRSRRDDQGRLTKDTDEEAQDVDARRTLHAGHQADADTPGALEGRKPDAGRNAAVGEDELGWNEEESIADAEAGIKVVELVAGQIEL